MLLLVVSRKNMEDAHIACTEVVEVGMEKNIGDMVGLFGVFDGHGGEWSLQPVSQSLTESVSVSVSQPVSQSVSHVIYYYLLLLLLLLLC